MLIAYVRKSTEESSMQVQSIEDQKTAIKKFVEDKKLGNIEHWFEESHSASGLTKERKVFMKMIQFCENNPDGKIICWDKSRFGRFSNLKEFNYWIYRLQLCGWEVLFVNTVVNNDGSIGSEFADLADSFQHSEFSKKLSRDVIRGEMSAFRKGNKPGGNAPYGYDSMFLTAEGKPYQILRRTDNGTRQILDLNGNVLRTVPEGQKITKSASSDRTKFVPGDPLKVAVVKRIFDCYCNKAMGWREIAKILNAEQIPASNGGLWMPQVVGHVLDNPIYTGYLVWNKTSQAKHFVIESGIAVAKKSDMGRKLINDKSKWIYSDSQVHEVLISKEMFEKAQSIRKLRQKREHSNAGRTYSVYLCSGLIICMKCGSKMYGIKANHPAYRCFRAYQLGMCVNVPVFCAELDSLVASRVGVFVQQRIIEKRDKYLKMVADRISAGVTNSSDTIKGLEQKSKDLNRRILNLIECISPENKDLVNTKLTELKTELSAVESNLEKLRQNESCENPLDTAARILDTVQDGFEVFSVGNIKQRREILRTYIDRMEFDPDKGQLKIFFFSFPNCAGPACRAFSYLAGSGAAVSLFLVIARALHYFFIIAPEAISSNN